MTAWLTIVGVGDDGLAGLVPKAREALETADVVVGSHRLLKALPRGLRAERITWPSPFDPLAEKLKAEQQRKIVVMATGDPMWFGAGATLLRYFDPSELQVFPHPSAFSLAAARMGWPLQGVDTVSLHGRPTALIEPLIQPGARILALTGGADTPAEVCARLCRRGFDNSRISVLAHMGGELEARHDFSAGALPTGAFAAFHTLAIECVASSGAQVLPRSPGLPDDAYAHDGQLTKRDVRAATLSALCPRNDALLWDIGAGCGSIAIEWLRLCPDAGAIAFEANETRCAMIRTNMDRLGTPQLELVAGTAPACLADRPAPDAVFIGGGLSDDGVFEACWSALQCGGNLVANVVTLEGESRLAMLHQKHGGELIRIAVSHAIDLGDLRAMEPRMAVTQWRVRKP